MCPHSHDDHPPVQPRCCPCGCEAAASLELSRREFLGGVGAAVGGVALTGLSWSALAAGQAELESPPKRRTLVVQPILLYSTPTPHPQTSWRSWGGIQTQQDADQEIARIQGELAKLQAAADFPVKFLPVGGVQGQGDLGKVKGLAQADAFIVYAAGGWMDVLDTLGKSGKDVIIFVRHRSGPVYLWYEIVSPRYLRQHSDKLAVKGVDFQDVVVDSPEEILWRLRALCGLRNAVGSRIVAVGGASGWAAANAPQLARDRFKLDIRTVSYKDLGKLIQDARADKAAVARAHARAEEYLKIPDTKLETKKEFVQNAFLLEEIFRALMKQADCGAITINACMGTIMPMSQTTACLPLSTLNDAGYMAFCESDFVVVPSGILLGAISGRPTFLNDPTYPHDGIITLAHCTAPRKMDGKTTEPVRILTHFESDYGASPKVEMHNGQQVTNIIPDFLAKHYVGFLGEIVAHQFLPICRSQIDVAFKCDTDLLAQRMPGFHWMTGYGDYRRELGYALKRVGIEWELLG